MVPRDNVDPKPITGISPYSVFGSNPILNNDPFGDSTVCYTLAGEKIGTLRDNLNTEIHFFNVEADKGAEFINQMNSLKLKDRNNVAKYPPDDLHVAAMSFGVQRLF